MSENKILDSWIKITEFTKPEIGKEVLFWNENAKGEKFCKGSLDFWKKSPGPIYIIWEDIEVYNEGGSEMIEYLSKLNITHYGIVAGPNKL